MRTPATSERLTPAGSAGLAVTGVASPDTQFQLPPVNTYVSSCIAVAPSGAVTELRPVRSMIVKGFDASSKPAPSPALAGSWSDSDVTSMFDAFVALSEIVDCAPAWNTRCAGSHCLLTSMSSS